MARKTGSDADWAGVKVAKKYGERQTKLAFWSLVVAVVALIIAFFSLARTF